MAEAYLSSNLQANPTKGNRDMNYSYRISKWKLYQNFLIISWISSPHSSEFKHRKDTDAMNLLLQDAAIIGSIVRHLVEMNWVVRGANLWWIIAADQPIYAAEIASPETAESFHHSIHYQLDTPGARLTKT